MSETKRRDGVSWNLIIAGLIALAFMGDTYVTRGAINDLAQQQAQSSALTTATSIRTLQIVGSQQTLNELERNGCSTGAAQYARIMQYPPPTATANSLLTDVCQALDEDQGSVCAELAADCRAVWCANQGNPPELTCKSVSMHRPRAIFPPMGVRSPYAWSPDKQRLCREGSYMDGEDCYMPVLN